MLMFTGSFYVPQQMDPTKPIFPFSNEFTILGTAMWTFQDHGSQY